MSILSTIILVKVSIVIPCFNAERHLKQCIDSVLAQTLREIEVLCVDDGSTDGTARILGEYANLDKRVRVFSQENQGPGVARNFAIQAAKGEFVAFVDADDFYPNSQVLEKLYCAATENRVLICGGSGSNFDGKTGAVSTCFSGQDAWGYSFAADSKIQYRDYQFDYNYHRFIYNREFLIEKEILFPALRRFEDPVFFVNAMLAAGAFYAMRDVAYCYRLDIKKVIWTPEKAQEVMRGIGVNLQTAERENLRKLYELTILRLEEHLRFFSHLQTLDYAVVLLRLHEQIKAQTRFVDLKANATHLLTCALFGARSPSGLGSYGKRKVSWLMLKSCFLFPWYVYKMSSAFFCNLPRTSDERVSIRSLVCAYIAFPFYFTKSYLSAMELKKFRF